MKIISVIDWFKIGNGATSEITYLNKFLELEGIDYSVLFDYSEGIVPPKTYQWSDEIFAKMVCNEEDVVVHYYLSGGNRGKGVFSKLVNYCKSQGLILPIVTSVLQRPSYAYCMLTPYIIENSSHIIFIDKASYNDPLYKFIPDERKSMFYCCFPWSDSKIAKLDQLAKNRENHRKEERFVYGRGSVINKCPKDTIDIFKQIDVNSKYFIICGVDDDSWIALKARHEDNIVTYPHKSYEEWELICSTFDVFLYYLPKNTYSSLDGNLGLAMKLGIPPIVYGPDAPKERIVQGINGFVAETKEEIVKYAKLLYEDDDLRTRMGKNARDMTYAMFHGRQTLDGHIALYKKLLSGDIGKNFVIPKSLSMTCFIKSHIFLAKMFVEKMGRFFSLIINPSVLFRKLNLYTK